MKGSHAQLLGDNYAARPAGAPPARRPLQCRDGRFTFLIICCIVLSAFLYSKIYGTYRSFSEPRSVLQLVSRDGVLYLEKTEETGDKKLNDSRKTAADLTPFFFQPLPINFAKAELLETINGIGPRLAEEIVRTREARGFFTGPDALRNVPGIGPKRIKQFETQISFATRP